MPGFDIIAHMGSRFIFFIIGLAGLGFLIGFHELGHFVFCKIFKIRTPSFSIGFGPKIFQKKIGDTVFALSAIPLGGYVEIAGHAEIGQGDQKDSAAQDAHAFYRKPYYQKLLVMLGGILFNLIFAYLVFVAFFLKGMPKTPLLFPRNATATVAEVFPNTPAQAAGIQTNDQILSVNGIATNGSFEKLLSLIGAHPNEEVALEVARPSATTPNEETTIQLQAKLADAAQAQKSGFLGVRPAFKELEPMGFFEATRNAFSLIIQTASHIINGFISIIKTRNTDGVGGPLMMIAQTIKSAEKGIVSSLLLLAIISINLAVLNIFPLPILDGGQLLLITVEAIARRRLPENIRLAIHLACWILMLGLVIYLTIKDVPGFLRSLQR